MQSSFEASGVRDLWLGHTGTITQAIGDWNIVSGFV
jgi:hypothetical protein